MTKPKQSLAMKWKWKWKWKFLVLCLCFMLWGNFCVIENESHRD